MQGLRELARTHLARSLRRLDEEDRLALALPAVCGSVMAAHCTVGRLDEERTLHLRVDAPEWMSPLLGMRERLHHDLQRIAGVPVTRLHFEVGASPKARTSR